MINKLNNNLIACNWLGLKERGFYHDVNDAFLKNVSIYFNIRIFLSMWEKLYQVKLIFVLHFRFKERGEGMWSQFCSWRRLRWFGGGDIFGACRDTDGPECSHLLTTAEDSFTEASQEYRGVSENFKLGGKLSFTYKCFMFYMNDLLENYRYFLSEIS